MSPFYSSWARKAHIDGTINSELHLSIPKGNVRLNKSNSRESKSYSHATTLEVNTSHTGHEINVLELKCGAQYKRDVVRGELSIFKSYMKHMFIAYKHNSHHKTVHIQEYMSINIEYFYYRVIFKHLSKNTTHIQKKKKIHSATNKLPQNGV